MSTLKVANVHFDSAGTNRIGYDNSGTIRLTTQDTDKLVVVSSGNVGIGTIAPTATLHVSGNTIISSNLLIGRTTSTVGLGVKLDVNGTINCANIFVNGNAVGGGGSVTISDETTTPVIQYVTFTTSTTGTASSINVASSKLTFNVSTGTLSATVFNSTSDRNKKENITNIIDALNMIDDINGVRFNWKDNKEPSAGVIAQDVEKIMPEIVGHDKSVNYNGIIAILIEAVKELRKEVNELKKGK